MAVCIVTIEGISAGHHHVRIETGFIVQLQLHVFAEDVDGGAIEVSVNAPRQVHDHAAVAAGAADHGGSLAAAELMPVGLLGFPGHVFGQGHLGNRHAHGLIFHGGLGGDHHIGVERAHARGKQAHFCVARYPSHGFDANQVSSGTSHNL
ncbi:MAG TPA: hypothetical protein VFL86_27795 [Burkholderiaceae bacterium]|nr:hypothetical protein [Burkholderiaceae bacterium]